LIIIIITIITQSIHEGGHADLHYTTDLPTYVFFPPLASFGRLYGKYASVLGRDALMCCYRYNGTINSFLLRNIQLSNNFYTQQLRINMTDFELNSLIEVMFIRERQLTFPDSFFLSLAQLTDIINALAIV